MKSKCRLLKKGWLVSMVTMLCAGAFQVAALADQEAEDDTYDVILIDEDQGEALANVRFSIYRIGDLVDSETIELEPEYDEACVYLELDDTEEWAAGANTLDAYLMLRKAEGNPIEPVAAGVTDGNGALEFNDLEEGLYLVTGSSATMGQTIYTPSASLLLLADEVEVEGDEQDIETQALPAVQDLEDDEVTVYVKNGYREVRDESETVSFSAVKIWKDKDDLENRPTSVSLVLLGDGEEYERVELNEENNWRYTWYDMSPNKDWKLVEVDVPEEHTVTVESDGYIFIVTNTKRPPSDRLGDMSSGDGIPSYSLDDSSETVTEPGETSQPETTVEPETTTKPQVTSGGGTGDTSKIWELIPVLGYAGIVLVIAGWGIRRKADNRHEK